MSVETKTRRAKVPDVDHVPAAVAVSEADRRAEEHEQRIKEQQTKQFQVLKDTAHALFGMVDGCPGVRSAGGLSEAP